MTPEVPVGSMTAVAEPTPIAMGADATATVPMAATGEKAASASVMRGRLANTGVELGGLLGLAALCIVAGLILSRKRV